MAEAEVWSVGRLLTWTADYLKQHGVAEPRLDAEVLLAEARGCQRIDLYAAFNDPATDAVRTTFRALVKRRADGTPVAYLVGRREFYSLNFRVTPDVLIPRPETELVVVTVLDRLKELARAGGNSAPRVADVGTGSGAIAVTVAKHAPNCRVTAIDISSAALAIAKENATTHRLADRIEFVESDLFAGLPQGVKFDVIASNPPYISTAEMETLADDVRNHEPTLALHAGERGSEVIERLIAEAAERLVPGGWLVFEISPMLKQSVESLLAADGRFEPAATIKDLAGHARVAQARLR